MGGGGSEFNICMFEDAPHDYYPCVCMLYIREGGCQIRYQHKRSFSLSLSEPGGAILTDQGFTIQVGTSQQLSRVRIHVELVIGLIKNKGQNTQREPYPGSASDVVNIDEIHTICGA